MLSINPPQERKKTKVKKCLMHEGPSDFQFLSPQPARQQLKLQEYRHRAAHCTVYLFTVHLPFTYTFTFSAADLSHPVPSQSRVAQCASPDVTKGNKNFFEILHKKSCTLRKSSNSIRGAPNSEYLTTIWCNVSQIMSSIKLYCFVIEAMGCEKPA